MKNPNEYALICRLTSIDGETMFEARVLELPDVVGYGENREEATEAALEAITGLQNEASKRGRTFPSPANIPEESGRITLRAPKSVHQRAVVYAALSDVSLNTLILTALVDYLARQETPIKLPEATLCLGAADVVAETTQVPSTVHVARALWGRVINGDAWAAEGAFGGAYTADTYVNTGTNVITLGGFGEFPVRRRLPA